MIRHGSYCKPPSGEKNRDCPLTPEGKQQAHAAGQFLDDLGIVPDFVVSTNTKRTRRTARIALDAMDIQCPIHWVSSGWRAGASRSQIETRVREWASRAPTPPECMMFVGHRAQLTSLKKALGIEKMAGKLHGAALVIEISDAGAWTLVAKWDGS